MPPDDDFLKLPENIYVAGITYIFDDPEVLEFSPPARPPETQKPAPEQP